VIVAIVATPFVFLAWSAWRSSVDSAAMTEKVRSSFHPVACEIKSATWSELRSSPGGVTRTGNGQPTITVVSGYDAHVEFSYSINGQAFLSRRISPHYGTIPTRPELDAFLARYQVRPGYTCYYDPANPSVAFLEQ
jgi:hypothetical protein